MLLKSEMVLCLIQLGFKPNYPQQNKIQEKGSKK